MIEFITTVVVAFAAAYFSARFGVHQALSEKIWNQKHQAYEEALTALHDMLRFSSIRADELRSNESYSITTELAKKSNEAFWRIQKIADIGPFILSRDAIAIMEEVRSQGYGSTDDGPLSEDDYVQDWKIYKHALDRLREIAKHDLKIREA